MYYSLYNNANVRMSRKHGHSTAACISVQILIENIIKLTIKTENVLKILGSRHVKSC